MNISLSDLYNSAAKSPEDKSEAGETSKDKKETSEESKPDEEKEPAEEKTEEGETQRSLLVPLNLFKYLMFLTFLCID